MENLAECGDEDRCADFGKWRFAGGSGRGWEVSTVLVYDQ